MTLKPKPSRLSPCRLHPQQPLTPLCAPCLRERLSLLNPSSSSSSSLTSTTSSSSSAAAFPELRRCNTFSADNCHRLSHEPRRRSCQVRTLEDLFSVDDSNANAVESSNLGLRTGTYPVPELREEEDPDDDTDSEIRVSAHRNVDDGIEDSRTIKEFIDLELNTNKPASASSFWIAASVFSRKLHKWKRKQKTENRPPEVGDCGFGRRSCDTDPRVSIDLGRASIDGIGKRFFDTDPRYSLDLARASVDCSGLRIKETCFDPPRASWDGRTSVSVIENAMATVYGFDTVQKHKILITEKELMNNSKRHPTATLSNKSNRWGRFLNIWGRLGAKNQHKSVDEDAGGDHKFNGRKGKCSIGKSSGGVLDRNPSVRHSSHEHENGTLGFYLTPSRRSKNR